jgi:hypothetical protein
MPRLPESNDLEHTDFPELDGIFRGVDAAIAAMIAADPAFRPKSAHHRSARFGQGGVAPARSRRASRRNKA